MPLTQRCNRSLRRKLNTIITKRTDGKPYRRRNHFLAAYREFNRYVKETKKLAKQHPHVCGPHARQYFLDTKQTAKVAAEAEAAIHKIYGPGKPGDPPLRPGVWTRRYFLNPEWKGFHKWFRKTYGN